VSDTGPLGILFFLKKKKFPQNSSFIKICWVLVSKDFLSILWPWFKVKKLLLIASCSYSSQFVKPRDGHGNIFIEFYLISLEMTQFTNKQHRKQEDYEFR